MKMNVNTTEIKNQRDKRCLSQEQLAEIAGLSLRTVQRIEVKGVASGESIKSIAAALDLDCQQLLAVQSTTRNTEAPVPPSQPIPSQSLPVSQHLRVKYLIGLLAVIAANCFGFWGIYSAFQSGSIDQQTMTLLKDTVAITLLLSIAVICYRGWRKQVFKFDL
ncbi:hypothetical protein CWC05_04085 [Pseudoalteromonas ruthenica]|uniref:HTH cro/C1-type domain-containing protein n=1 Tax=Pseudoalteromonas ruthenica TaxID=151081 RepID=A0A5S3Z8T6_9GAMM|nr:helix-turn-helix domain-containing protein [Pseudoalteromonas ruthenica]TMP88618.1 hypothetical protein CWC05_04085 [Pseudoalteromonas ruthenica]